MLEKIENIKKMFEGLTAEERYQRIMELGSEQAKLAPEWKTEACRVKGCQSRMYLRVYEESGKLYFETEADALISAGLGALLTRVYSGEEPEAIFKWPPKYLEELGINASLSPSRANGLASLVLAMKREALKFC